MALGELTGHIWMARAPLPAGAVDGALRTGLLGIGKERTDLKKLLAMTGPKVSAKIEFVGLHVWTALGCDRRAVRGCWWRAHGVEY